MPASPAGIVLGILALIIAMGLIVFVIASAFDSPASQSYLRCLQQAGADQGKTQQCVLEPTTISAPTQEPAPNPRHPITTRSTAQISGDDEQPSVSHLSRLEGMRCTRPQ